MRGHEGDGRDGIFLLILKNSTTIITFADDTAILSRHTNLDIATANLQAHLYSIEKWTRKWRLKN